MLVIVLVCSCSVYLSLKCHREKVVNKSVISYWCWWLWQELFTTESCIDRVNQVLELMLVAMFWRLSSFVMVCTLRSSVNTLKVLRSYISTPCGNRWNMRRFWSTAQMSSVKGSIRRHLLYISAISLAFELLCCNWMCPNNALFVVLYQSY